MGCRWKRRGSGFSILWPPSSCPAWPRSPLWRASFHPPAAFKTRQLTFQPAGWTSRCLCGGLPSGLCAALSVDGHTGSSLSASACLSLARLAACVRFASPPLLLLLLLFFLTFPCVVTKQGGETLSFRDDGDFFFLLFGPVARGDRKHCCHGNSCEGSKNISCD